LGGYFLKYGSGMDKWDELIADARQLSLIKWNRFVNDFIIAFNAGDLVKLDELKTHDGFWNIDDLGGYFLKYGSGMDKWDELIARKKI